MDVLKFFNLLDRAGKLSITNLAVYVLVIKIGAAPTLDWAVVAGLLVTLLNYTHKRMSEKPVTIELPTELQTSIDAVAKTANEAKDLAQKLSLANGLIKLK